MSRCTSSRDSEVGFVGVRWCIRVCFAKMQLPQLMFPSTECTLRPPASDWHAMSLMLAAPIWPSLRCQSSTDFDCEIVVRRVNEVRISLPLPGCESCDRMVPVTAVYYRCRRPWLWHQCRPLLWQLLHVLPVED